MSAVVDIATQMLMNDEGFRASSYRDSRGILTIGYGFNLEVPWSRDLCTVILGWHVQDKDRALSAYYWYSPLDDVRKSVVIDVAFNVGLDGLLHFPKMIAALAAKDWNTASAQLLDSDAARLNTVRYARLADILKTGVPK